MNIYVSIQTSKFYRLLSCLSEVSAGCPKTFSGHMKKNLKSLFLVIQSLSQFYKKKQKPGCDISFLSIEHFENVVFSLT